MLEIDGKVRGFAGIRDITQIEPLGATDGFSATLLGAWLDGKLADRPEYQFFVDDSNAEFKKHVEKHFPVTDKYEIKGTLYVCRRT